MRPKRTAVQQTQYINTRYSPTDRFCSRFFQKSSFFFTTGITGKTTGAEYPGEG